MPAAGVILEDGRRRSEVAVPVALDSPMWTQGQSLFETLLVRPEGAAGLYAEEEHAQRLVQSARMLGWPGVPPARRLVEWMRQAARCFRAEHPGFGRMRLTVAWVRAEAEPVTYVTVVPYSRPRTPLSVAITPVRVPWPEGMSAAKSGSRVSYTLAERWAGERGCDEGLLVDGRGRPVEGARSNLFLVGERELVTPPAHSGVLPGVTRAKVIELARRAGWSVAEAPIDWERLAAAQAVVMTNALWGVRPVERLDRRRLPVDGAPVQELKALYEADVERYLRSRTG